MKQVVQGSSSKAAALTRSTAEVTGPVVGGSLLTVMLVVGAAASGTTAWAQPVIETFAFTGEPVTFDVPANVCEVIVDAYGAQGGDGGGSNPNPDLVGGLGAAATEALLEVTPGEQLLVVVGGAGGNGTFADGGAGGFNGGGAGGEATGEFPVGGGGGGGGASEVRRGDDVLLIAGAGGGGGGATDGGAGGDGGEVGTDGGDGNEAGSGGEGGTGEQGGSGGVGTDQNGGDGAAGTGGAGGSGTVVGGGGGGAGAFGGGGGGGMIVGTGPGGGGGGGSSFGPAGTVFETGFREGDGLIEITYEPDPVNCAEADLTINKEATVNAEGAAAFSLAVENLGPDDATGVVVTDELPACTTYISDECGGTNVPPWTWPIGPLASGNSVSCTLTVDASGCAGEGEQINVATMAADQEDPVEDNNSAGAGFEIVEEKPGEADLSIALAATVVGNPTAELEVMAGNAGPDPATGVEVALELPECTAFESDTCDGTSTDGEWTWAVGALAADATTACTVTVDILDCEPPPTFIATIAGDQADPETANNTAELQLEIEPVPALPLVALVLLAVALSGVALHRLRRGPRTER